MMDEHFDDHVNSILAEATAEMLRYAPGISQAEQVRSISTYVPLHVRLTCHPEKLEPWSLGSPAKKWWAS
jgi:hypothetical protein